MSHGEQLVVRTEALVVGDRCEGDCRTCVVLRGHSRRGREAPEPARPDERAELTGLDRPGQECVELAGVQGL